MSDDDSVIKVSFPNKRVDWLYHEIFKAINNELTDNMTCVEIIGVIELVKSDYIKKSFGE